MSLLLGSAVILGGAGCKGGVKFSPWPLVAAVSGTLLCLQIGYLAAPLTLTAEGDWWRWSLAGMLPPAAASLLSLTRKVAQAVRQAVAQERPATVQPTLTLAVIAQALMYVGAPLVLWLARSPQGG